MSWMLIFFAVWLLTGVALFVAVGIIACALIWDDAARHR